MTIKQFNNLTIPQLLYLIIIFFLPTQFGKHFWPDFSLVSGMRIDYLSPTLYLTDALIVILFIAWIIQEFPIKTKPKSDYRLSLIGVLLFVVCLVIGITFSSRPTLGLLGLLKLAEFVFFGWFTAKIISQKNVLKKVLIVFSLSMLLQSTLAITQFYKQQSLGGLVYYLGERAFDRLTPGIANASLAGELVLRPYGTLPHPNVLAGYLLIGLVLLLVNIKLFSENKKNNLSFIIVFAGVVVGTIALLISLSRLTIFLGLVILGFWLFQLPKKQYLKLQFKNKKNLTKRFINIKHTTNKNFLIAVIICFLIFFISPTLLLRFQTISPTDETISQRIILTQASLSMTLDHPVLGVGLQQFLVKLPKYEHETNLEFLLQPVHNIFLYTVAETGIIGFIFFIIFIFITIRKHIFNKNKIPGVWLVFVLILFIGLGDHYFLTLQQGRFLFSFVWGLMFAKNSF